MKEPIRPTRTPSRNNPTAFRNRLSCGLNLKAISPIPAHWPPHHPNQEKITGAILTRLFRAPFALEPLHRIVDAVRIPFRITIRRGWRPGTRGVAATNPTAPHHSAPVQISPTLPERHALIFPPSMHGLYLQLEPFLHNLAIRLQLPNRFLRRQPLDGGGLSAFVRRLRVVGLPPGLGFVVLPQCLQRRRRLLRLLLCLTQFRPGRDQLPKPKSITQSIQFKQSEFEQPVLYYHITRLSSLTKPFSCHHITPAQQPHEAILVPSHHPAQQPHEAILVPSHHPAQQPCEATLSPSPTYKSREKEPLYSYIQEHSKDPTPSVPKHVLCRPPV